MVTGRSRPELHLPTEKKKKTGPFCPGGAEGKERGKGRKSTKKGGDTSNWLLLGKERGRVESGRDGLNL